MGTTTGVGFVPTPTQVEEYTHRLTGNKTGTVYTHTHTHTLDVRSRQPPEPTGSTPEETNRGSGAACYNWGPLREISSRIKLFDHGPEERHSIHGSPSGKVERSLPEYTFRTD